MNITDGVENVDMVDKLMICFRNGVEPADADIAKAYRLGINVNALKFYVEEYENESTESETY